MVVHLVMWNFKEDFPQDKKEELAKAVDTRLKALIGVVKGLERAEMKLSDLSGSNRELLLISELDSAEDLAAYQIHPLHVAIAEELIKPNTADRACFDYTVLS